MKMLVTSFLMPPGLALIFLILALIWFRKYYTRAQVCLVLGIMMVWVTATPAFARLLGTALISQINGPSLTVENKPDLIIVLTGGMYHAGNIGWMPTQDSFRRLQIGFEVQERLGSRVPILVSGGKTKGAQYPSEARVVRDYFRRNKAQITPVVLEEFSKNTYENAFRSISVIQDNGYRDVVLVTSELHMPRALAVFRAQGVNPVPFPVVTLKRGPLGAKDFLPGWEGLEQSAKALYEILGIVQYIFTDRIHYKDVFYESSSGIMIH